MSDVVRLGDCVEKCDSWSPSDGDPGAEFTYIDIAAVDREAKRIEDPTRIRCADAPSRARQIVKAGDVLVSTVRPNLNAVALVPEDLDGAIASTGFTVLRCRKEVLEPRYLYQWVKSPGFMDQMVRQATGASYPAVSDRIVLAAEMPMSCLPEQRRIAAILDKADVLRAKRREVIAKIEQILSAAFLECVGEMIGQPISIGKPKHGDAERYVPLQQVARMATGHTPSRRVPEYWGGDVPWISLSDIRRLDGRLAEDTEQSTTPEGIKNSSAVILPAMTVCFSRTASVGFSTILGREMATSQDFVNWICGDQIDPFYLMAAFRASRSYLISNSSGSTHKTIYFPVAERFHVLLPSIERQRRFAGAVKSIWKIRDKLDRQSAVIEELFRSIQGRAFQGAL